MVWAYPRALDLRGAVQYVGSGAAVDVTVRVEVVVVEAVVVVSSVAVCVMVVGVPTT